MQAMLCMSPALYSHDSQRHCREVQLPCRTICLLSCAQVTGTSGCTCDPGSRSGMTCAGVLERLSPDHAVSFLGGALGVHSASTGKQHKTHRHQEQGPCECHCRLLWKASCTASAHVRASRMPMSCARGVCHMSDATHIESCCGHLSSLYSPPYAIRWTNPGFDPGEACPGDCITSSAPTPREPQDEVKACPGRGSQQDTSG